MNVLEIGDHTFTARLCQRRQILEERVCDLGITKILVVWSNAEFELLVVALMKIPVLLGVTSLKEYPSYKCFSVRLLS
jgi:hypothetical protein